ncbi:MAG: LON peptidase substrate-binding domain-containing protein, partial [Acetanaerobacterium sp.]
MDQKSAQTKNARLPMLALRGLVVYPNMVLHFDVGRKKSVLALNEAMGDNQLVFLVAQKDIREDEPKDYDLYSVGVVAEVRQILKMPGDSLRVLVEGLYRAKMLDIVQEDPFMSAMVEELPLKNVRTKSQKDTAEALMRTVKDLFEEYSYLTPQMPKDYMLNVMASEDPVYLCEYITGNLMLKAADKQRILEESSPIKRLELLLQILEDENSVLTIEKDLYERVKQQVDKNQREYFLREQMKVISSELGEG